MKHYAPKICLPLKMPKSEKGHDSVIYVWKFAKSQSGYLHFGHNMCARSPDILLTRLHRFTMLKSKKGSHLHLRHNLCAKYHDPSSCGSPDILLTNFHRFTMHKSEKGQRFCQIITEFYEKLIRSSASCIQIVYLLSWSKLKWVLSYFWQDCFTVQNAKVGKGW